MNSYTYYLEQIYHTYNKQFIELMMPSELELLFDNIYLINIARKEKNDAPLRCTEILDFSHIGSPVTLHKRLKALIHMGFLEYGEDKDGRNKPVLVGPKGTKRINYLSRLMEDAVSYCKKDKKTG